METRLPNNLVSLFVKLATFAANLVSGLRARECQHVPTNPRSATSLEGGELILPSQTRCAKVVSAESARKDWPAAAWIVVRRLGKIFLSVPLTWPYTV